MKKADKTTLVEDLNKSFGRASIAIISEYRGMTAAESTEMRKRLRAVSGEMRVAKNTLVKLAIKGTPYEALESQLGGQIGLIFSYEDPVEVAKTFTGFGVLGEKLKLRGAVLGGKPLSVQEVQALATLPSREVIFSQLLGLLNAPATQLVRLLNEPGSYLVRMLDAIGKKNGDRPAAAAETAANVEAAPQVASAEAAAPEVAKAEAAAPSVEPAAEAKPEAAPEASAPEAAAPSAEPSAEGSAPAGDAESSSGTDKPEDTPEK
jgi:large subunit ribosomal protein L10